SGRLIPGRGALGRRAIAALGAGVRPGATGCSGGLARRRCSSRCTAGRAMTRLLVAAGFYVLVVAPTTVALGPGVIVTVDVAVAVRIALVRFALAGIDRPVSVLICSRAALGTRGAGASLRSPTAASGPKRDHLFSS